MDNPQLEQLANQVLSGAKYKHITSNLVRRLCQEAITAGFAGKAAVKFVRNKLHQVGGAYLKQKSIYAAAIQQLKDLPREFNSPETQDFCRRMLQSHASTAERLPVIETFFQTCLTPIAPVTGIIDLACGLNPLALPWIPVADHVQYFACDIYLDLLDLVNAFFDQFCINGAAEPCDLIAEVPAERAQVAFLLKSIPCLEQMEKSIGERLLEDTPADHILVSFPVHSLAGRKKGMSAFYKEHFLKLVGGKPWEIQEFLFQTELAFLVSK